MFKGINSYRQSKKLAPLVEVSKAECLAGKVAEEIEKTPCENVNQFYPSTVSGGSNIPNLRKHIEKCDINITTTTDGVILPVCVPKLEPTIVLSNYTHSDRCAQFLNNSKYSGAGLGSEDDWMVLVLTTNTATGTFSASSATSLLHSNVASVGLFLFALLLLLTNFFHWALWSFFLSFILWDMDPLISLLLCNVLWNVRCEVNLINYELICVVVITFSKAILSKFSINHYCYPKRYHIQLAFLCFFLYLMVLGAFGWAHYRASLSIDQVN